MANLAIKGHGTRGKEVIEILKMLGGHNNSHNFLGGTEYNYYYIGKYSTISCIPKEKVNSSFITFTLEEFLDKFPYKVGNEVKLDYWPCTIQSMEWDEYKNTILYTVRGLDFCKCVYSEDLQPYKEETMEDTSQMTEKQIVFGDDSPNKKIFVCVDDFEFKYKDGIIYIVRKNPPKTYEECYKIVYPNSKDVKSISVDGHNWHSLQKLSHLLLCRDAYWKIAGEQMRLGEPWRPDWKDCTKPKYTIHLHSDGHIFWQDVSHTEYRWLSFPTKEMRDVFYESFKDLIEQCKELL